jgi:hypothetical protein
MSSENTQRDDSRLGKKVFSKLAEVNELVILPDSGKVMG